MLHCITIVVYLLQWTMNVLKVNKNFHWDDINDNILKLFIFDS